MLIYNTKLNFKLYSKYIVRDIKVYRVTNRMNIHFAIVAIYISSV